MIKKPAKLHTEAEREEEKLNIAVAKVINQSHGGGGHNSKHKVSRVLWRKGQGWNCSRDRRKKWVKLIAPKPSFELISSRVHIPTSTPDIPEVNPSLDKLQVILVTFLNTI